MMPPVHSTPMEIDPQWAQTLVALPMSVPEHWWDECKGNTLFKDRIVGVNWKDPSERYFVFECEDGDDDNTDNERERFPMRYDAVFTMQIVTITTTQNSTFQSSLLQHHYSMKRYGSDPVQTKNIVSGSVSEAVVDDATIYTVKTLKSGTLSKGNNVDKRWEQLNTLPSLRSLK